MIYQEKKMEIIILISFLGMLLINTAGAFGMINQLSQKQVSEMFPSIITPSPFTFGIWSIIYGLLIIFILFCLYRKIIKKPYPIVQGIYGPLLLSCVCNALWIISFAYVQLELSLLFILGLFFSLYQICIQVKSQNLFLKTTFAIYTGWVLVASVINLFAIFTKYQLFFLSQILFVGVFAILLVLITGWRMKLQIQNSTILLSIIWAVFGIVYPFIH